MNWEIKKYPLNSCRSRKLSPGVEPDISFGSRSVKVGNLIFLSGVIGNGPGQEGKISTTFENQVLAAFSNIKLALEQAGSSLDNLVKYYIFLKHVKDAPRMWQIMLEYFQVQSPKLLDDPPAVAVCQVESFEHTECLIEIDAIAVVVGNQPDWEMKKYPMKYGGVKGTCRDKESGKPFFSESVAVGNLIFLSAVSAENIETGKIETDNFEEQMDIEFEKIKAALQHCGSSASNIIKTLHFMTGVDTLLARSLDIKQSFSPASDRLWKRELEHYNKDAPVLFDLPPASTFLKVSALAAPGAQVQLDVTAVIDRDRTGWKVKNYLLYLGKRGFPRHAGEIKKYYSNSVVVGNLVFLSGQTPTDLFTARIESDIFEEQAKVALNNFKIALEETGSSLDNLIKTTVLVPDPDNLPSFRKLELEFYRKYAPGLSENPPATTVIHPLNLAGTNLKIEIEALAVVADSQA